MRYLVVIAHPDDEVLGCGASIHKLTSEGHSVALCIMSSCVEVRTNASDTLEDDCRKVRTLLGIEKVYNGIFPNIKMNTVAHLDLVRFIENAIEDFGADAIITHHPSDVNNDHVMTYMAAQAASRLFQRKNGIPPLKLFLCMEVLSSTEWSLGGQNGHFTPNYFVEIGKEGVDIKLKALSEYKGVMRDYPHPRSIESVSGLAAYRGSQSGCLYAEAFECVFGRI